MPWLLKAEPDSRIVKGVDVKYTIDDLKRDETSPWEGVRNPEARKNMIAMKEGDLAFFYRSNTKVPGIVGVMTVSKEAYEDYTALDTKHPYYDARAEKGNKWVMVDVKYQSHVELITLAELKANPNLSEMSLIKRSRLSISPVRDTEWQEIMRMIKAKGGTIPAIAELSDAKTDAEQVKPELEAETEKETNHTAPKPKAAPKKKSSTKADEPKESNKTKRKATSSNAAKRSKK